GLLPRQRAAVQGRSDRLATAPQPKALAHPRDEAAQGPAWRWIGPGSGRRRGRTLGGADRLAAFGCPVRVRLPGAGKKGTAAAGAAERERVGTLGIVGMNPAHHGLGMASGARGQARGAPALRDLEESKR